jgi:uncharacterized protein (DUF3820 family)
MDNLKIYNMGRTVPDEAKKPITAGRLKGMTDINPMWRIKRLTEMFGACGVGWWYEITDKRIVCDELTNQKAAFVDILLFFIDPDTGKESHGVPGTGGSSFVTQERNGAYLSDECFKMALTDAISVSAKALGIGADVYFDKDRTKYTGQEEQPPKATVKTVEEAAAYVITFGKYNGRTLGELFHNDLNYVQWLYENDRTDAVIKGAIDILLKAATAKR